MKVSLIDLRREDNLSQDGVRSLEENDATIIVILGHGSPETVAGLTRDTFPTFPQAKVVWMYACQCGLSLIGEIARRGLIVFGYVTNVLAPESAESTVATHIKNLLESYAGEINAASFLRYVHDGLLAKASDLIIKAKQERNGLYLLQAALINHTRLSVRVAQPNANPPHILR